MIKQLKLNLAISTIIIFILLLLDSLSSFVFSDFFYIAPVFYFILYTAQNLLLNQKLSPTLFVFLYNLSAFIKLLLSAVFIIVYYLLFANQLEGEKTTLFSIFFICLYFIYLLLNTLVVFFYSNEKK